MANYRIARTAYHALMNADFTTVGGTANTYPANNGITYADYFINVEGDASFNDNTNTTYFNADLIHGTATMYDLLSNTYLTPVTSTF